MTENSKKSCFKSQVNVVTLNPKKGTTNIQIFETQKFLHYLLSKYWMFQ